MFQRIKNLIRGFFGLFLSGIERNNPEALMEVEKENLRLQISRYNQGLASHAGMCERLMSQVKKLETDERELKARTSAHLKAGNKEAAAQYALRLQTVSREFEENKLQLKQAETTYKDMLKARDVSITAAKSKLEALKQGIDDMRVKQAMAEMTEMASGMISSIGGSGDTLNRLQEMVEEERNNAAGRARVAKDSMDMTDINIKEAEQSALANQALADFAAKEGIYVGPAETPESSSTDQVKTMGPKESN